MIEMMPTGRRDVAFAARPVAVLIAAVTLCWAAIVNGQPFFHPDTGAYVRGPDVAISKLIGERFATPWAQAAPVSPNARADGVQAGPGAIASTDDDEVLAGRSIYYGVLAWLGQVGGGFWLTVLTQGLAVALLADIALRALGARSLRAYAGTIAALALLTPASLFISLLMPDIWAGVAVGALATLFALSSRISRVDAVALSLMLVFATMAHNSHLLIVAAVTGLGLIAWAMRGFKGPDARLGAGLGVAAVLAAVAGTLTFSTLVEKTAGKPPITPPFLTARVIEDGPGTRFVKERCADGRFEVCRYAHRLPLAVDEFLWVQDPKGGVFETLLTDARRRLSEEQVRFALAAVTAYPVEQAAATAKNVALQLGTSELKDFGYKASLKETFQGQLPAEHLRRMQTTLAWREAWPLHAMANLHVAIFALAGLAVAWSVLKSRGEALGPDADAQDAMTLFAVLLVAGVLANGIACGALSALHGRYQARVAWLIPLAAFGLILAQAHGRQLSRRVAAVVAARNRTLPA
jgi:hypothetical protein